MTSSRPLGVDVARPAASMPPPHDIRPRATNAWSPACSRRRRRHVGVDVGVREGISSSGLIASAWAREQPEARSSGDLWCCIGTGTPVPRRRPPDSSPRRPTRSSSLGVRRRCSDGDRGRASCRRRADPPGALGSAPSRGCSVRAVEEHCSRPRRPDSPRRGGAWGSCRRGAGGELWATVRPRPQDEPRHGHRRRHEDGWTVLPEALPWHRPLRGARCSMTASSAVSCPTARRHERPVRAPSAELRSAFRRGQGRPSTGHRCRPGPCSSRPALFDGPTDPCHEFESLIGELLDHSSCARSGRRRPTAA